MKAHKRSTGSKEETMKISATNTFLTTEEEEARSGGLLCLLSKNLCLGLLMMDNKIITH